MSLSTRLALFLGEKLRRVRVRGLPRIFYVTAPLVLGRGLRIQPTISHLSLSVDISDYASCMMVYGRFQPELVALLPRLVRPGDSVIDVGAQLGFVTSHLAALVGPRGSVASFEPDPNALKQLRATVAANQHAQVTIHALAASAHDGELTLHVSPTLGWSTAVDNTHHRDLAPTHVRCARLDTLAARGEIRRPVRLVKIDVEGYEHAVLDGAAQLLAEDRPAVLLELSELLLRPSGLKPADVVARLPPNYRVQRIVEPRGILAGGQVALEPFDPRRPPEFCDVLCSPL